MNSQEPAWVGICICTEACICGAPTDVKAIKQQRDEALRLLTVTESIAQFLFTLLDDIDTVSDWAKSDNSAYRKAVERMQYRRFEVASSDGYTVTWK